MKKELTIQDLYDIRYEARRIQHKWRHTPNHEAIGVAKVRVLKKKI